MDDQLDDDLKNRIREVFDNYEDTTADEGWLLLREKFPVQEKKRPVVWLWWASAAAGLLLFLGIGIWMLNNKPAVSTSTVLINPVKHGAQPKQASPGDTINLVASTQSSIIKNNAIDTATSIINNVGQKHTRKKSRINNTVDTAFSTSNNIAQNYSGKKQVISNPGVSTASANQNAVAAFNPSGKSPVNTTSITNPNANLNNGVSGNGNQFAKQQLPANKQPVIAPATVKKPDSVKTAIDDADNGQYAANPVAKTVNDIPPAVVVTPNTANQQPTHAKTSSANAMATMLATDNLHTTKTRAKSVDDKTVKFGIYAATFFNYAKGSANQVNAGAGFTSDIRLSKNIKITTGVALAQNTLKYNSSIPPNPSAANAVSSAITQQDNKLVPASSFPVFKNYNASLVGLDVPVNLKYEFNPEKTDAYFSAGLSSGTFINEAYTTSYGVPNSSLSSSTTQQTSEETNRQSFNGFYFAKMLNLSVGVGTALGKNRLIIEPFLKYPLQGLGAQQIKFGAGGLNLKFNFAGGKR